MEEITIDEEMAANRPSEAQLVPTSREFALLAGTDEKISEIAEIA